MKKLLVIADQQEGTQLAFLKAVELAKKTGAAIHVAAFCYTPMTVLTAYQVNQNGEDLKVKQIRQKEQWWHQFILDKQNGIDVSHEVVWEKNVHQWIVKHSKANNYDLILKTGHRSETAFYTPTDWQLFRDSKVPVYIATEKHKKAKQVVLVALDVLAKSEEKQRFNKSLIEQASMLAAQFDAVLHCAYVIKIPTLLKDLDLIDNDAYIRKAKVEAKAKFTTLVEPYNIPADCIHIQEGEPWGALSNLAKKLHVQCVVVGSMGRKGIVGKLIGNTAERIIHVVNTDLMVLSPEA